MLTTIIAMAIFAFIGAASPGPVNIIATSAAARFGLKGSLPHVVGASLAYAVIVFLAGIGLSQLLLASEFMGQWLRYLGTFFLLHLAYKIATADIDSLQHKGTQQEPIASPPTLWQGILSQSLNPKAWLVSMSGVSLFVTDSGQVMLYLAIFSTLSLLICFCGVGLWALLGRLLSEYLASPRRQLYFNRAMGLLLALSVSTMYLPT